MQETNHNNNCKESMQLEITISIFSPLNSTLKEDELNYLPSY